MTKKRQLKLIQAGEYVAEIEIELIYTEGDWSPYLSLNHKCQLKAWKASIQTTDYTDQYLRQLRRTRARFDRMNRAELGNSIKNLIQ
jgi:hypothetical protein